MKNERIIEVTANYTLYDEGEAEVKVFRADYPVDWVFNEAMLTVKAGCEKLGVPEVNSVFRRDGQWCISFSPVSGKTLLQVASEDINYLQDLLDELVELQLEIHDVRISATAPLKERFKKAINSLSVLPIEKKEGLLLLLETMPTHKKLCHCGYDLNAVRVGEKRQYIISGWAGACSGNGSADAAITYLRLSLVKTEWAERYLGLYCVKTGTSMDYARGWIPLAAAWLLSVGTNEEREKELLYAWLDIAEK